jgi:hypothetical protein
MAQIFFSTFVFVNNFGNSIATSSVNFLDLVPVLLFPASRGLEVVHPTLVSSDGKVV